jgi:hypothetical protein
MDAIGKRFADTGQETPLAWLRTTTSPFDTSASAS